MSQENIELIKERLAFEIDNLSKKYKITKRDKNKLIKTIKLKNPLRKKTIISYEDRCKARKQDGGQCSRRHKQNEHFCGKHILNHKYGTFPLTCLTQKVSKEENIEEHVRNKQSNKTKKLDIAKSNVITLRSVQINNKHYYIDKFNILYNPEPVNGLYEIIGKLTDESTDKIYYATMLT